MRQTRRQLLSLSNGVNATIIKLERAGNILKEKYAFLEFQGAGEVARSCHLTG